MESLLPKNGKGVGAVAVGLLMMMTSSYGWLKPVVNGKLLQETTVQEREYHLDDRRNLSFQKANEVRNRRFDPQSAACADGNGLAIDVDGDGGVDRLIPLNGADQYTLRIYRITPGNHHRSSDEGIWVLNGNFDGFDWKHHLTVGEKGVGWLHCFLRREGEDKAWVRILYDDAGRDLDRAQALVKFGHDGVRILRWKPRLAPSYRGAYIAKISTRDLSDREGRPLLTIGAILKRDRENFYQGRFDPEDTGMDRYRDPRERAMLERLPLLPRAISTGELFKRLKSGTTLLEVRPTPSGIEIRVLSSVSSLPSPAGR